MSDLKPCPFCDGEAVLSSKKKYSCCNNEDCEIYDVWLKVEAWSTRHIDAAQIEAETIERCADEVNSYNEIIKEQEWSTSNIASLIKNMPRKYEAK